jgi:transcriptional regulator with XRE-family HTH domain
MSTPRSPLGAKLHELREWSGLTLEQVAEACGCNVEYLGRVEKGFKRPSPRLLVLLADILDCDAAALETLAAQHERHRACGITCQHDGLMKEGGDPSLVFDDCMYYATCLSDLLTRHKKAKSAHCPPNCSRRRKTPSYIRIQADGGKNGERRWESTDPFDGEHDDDSDDE